MNRLSHIVIAVLLCSINLVGQHQHSATDEVIDGAVHPELIPDSTAYRLYFVAVSGTANPTAEEEAQQSASLKQIGLKDANDRHSLIGVLASFKAKYADLIARYNASAEAALESGVSPDIKTFLSQRDMLVQTTRDALKSLLTPAGITLLDKRVQHEKSQMVAAVEEGQ